MRNGGQIRDQAHFNSHRLDGADRGFASGAGAFDVKLNFLDAHRLGSLDRLLGRQTGGKRRAFAGALETS